MSMFALVLLHYFAVQLFWWLRIIGYEVIKRMTMSAISLVDPST